MSCGVYPQELTNNTNPETTDGEDKTIVNVTVETPDGAFQYVLEEPKKGSTSKERDDTAPSAVAT